MENEKTRLELIEKHIEKSNFHLEKMKQSFRWSVGNFIIRIIEICLFRKKSKLSIDYLSEHLESIRYLSQNNKTSDMDTRRGNHSSLHKPRTIGLHVSEKKINSIYGDVHVANDLKFVLEKEGHTVELLEKEDHTGTHDILFFLLWDTPARVKEKKQEYWIVWIRNYPDRWLTNPICSQVDLFLCSSEKMVDYMKKYFPKTPVYLFPLAANMELFEHNVPIPSNSTITFIGNKFTEKRAVENFIESGNAQIEVYGSGWKNKGKGPIARNKIPKIYTESRIILDAANKTTKEFESLNSRVFDAIASKRIIITDSEKAAKLFNAKIPTYTNHTDLRAKMNDFLTEDSHYHLRAELLYDELKAKHTFERRKDELKLILGRKLNIRIKIAASQHNKKYFGDSYFAAELKAALEYYGHEVGIDGIEDWYSVSSAEAELVIVLRGLKKYEPIKAQTNFLWMISHPSEISEDEMDNYESVFVASDAHYSTLKTRKHKDINLLLQCTNPSTFSSSTKNTDRKKKLLFIGNTRNVFRKSVKFALDSGFEIDVYGQGWEDFIDSKYIKGEFVENIDLPDMYNKYEVLLSDHWDDMLEYGYISNRIFDALSCGIKIISDQPLGIDKYFPNIFYYDDLNSFQKAVKECFAASPETVDYTHLEISNKHSFQERAMSLLAKYYFLTSTV